MHCWAPVSPTRVSSSAVLRLCLAVLHALWQIPFAIRLCDLQLSIAVSLQRKEPLTTKAELLLSMTFFQACQTRTTYSPSPCPYNVQDTVEESVMLHNSLRQVYLYWQSFSCEERHVRFITKKLVDNLLSNGQALGKACNLIGFYGLLTTALRVDQSKARPFAKLIPSVTMRWAKISLPMPLPPRAACLHFREGCCSWHSSKRGAMMLLRQSHLPPGAKTSAMVWSLQIGSKSIEFWELVLQTYCNLPPSCPKFCARR